MAGKSGRKTPRKSGGSSSSPRVPRFAFEAGERSFPLPVKTAAVEYGDDGQGEAELGLLAQPEEHLRGLGWRIVATIQGDGMFLTGIASAKSVVRNIPWAAGEVRIPALKMVGPPESSAVVIATVSLLYKPNV
jgi:hypothetical protein